MALAFIQPETGVAVDPVLETAFDAGQLFYYEGQINVGRSVVHWNFLVPENRIYDGAALLKSGFSGIEGSSDAPSLAHAQEGIAIGWFSPARKSDKPFYYDALNSQELHMMTIRGVFNAIHEAGPQIQREVPGGNTLDLSRHLLIAHSMGGLSVTRHALAETGSTDAILHKASCGFGHPELLDLAIDVPKGALAGFWHELLPSLKRGHIKPSLGNAREFIDYYRHLQVIAEAISCLTENVSEATALLMEAGVYVDYQAYEHDILVRPNVAIAEFVHTHSVMRNAGHLAPIRKATEVARHSSRALANLS